MYLLPDYSAVLKHACTVHFIGKGSGSESRLKLTSYCTCPGYYILTYECEVIGHHLDATIWRGSAFDCTGQEISLLHRLYTDNSTHTRAYGVCNDGSIVAQSLRLENDTYVSQLNVTVSDSVIGKSIECIFDNTSTTTTMIVGDETIHMEGRFDILANNLCNCDCMV